MIVCSKCGGILLADGTCLSCQTEQEVDVFSLGRASGKQVLGLASLLGYKIEEQKMTDENLCPRCGNKLTTYTNKNNDSFSYCAACLGSRGCWSPSLDLEAGPDFTICPICGAFPRVERGYYFCTECKTSGAVSLDLPKRPTADLWVPSKPSTTESFSQQEWNQLDELYSRAQRCMDAQAHARRKYHLDTVEHGLMHVPVDLLRRMLIQFRAPAWDIKSIKLETENATGEVRVPAALVVDLLSYWYRIRRKLDRSLEKLMGKSIIPGGEFLSYTPITKFIRQPVDQQPIIHTYQVPKNLRGATAIAAYCDEVFHKDSKGPSGPSLGTPVETEQATILQQIPERLRALAEYSENGWRNTEKGFLALECTAPSCLKIGCKDDHGKYIRACGLSRFNITLMGTNLRLSGDVVDVSGRRMTQESWAALSKLSGLTQDIMLMHPPRCDNTYLGSLHLDFFIAKGTTKVILRGKFSTQ